jgi:hypothetical protein
MSRKDLRGKMEMAESLRILRIRFARIGYCRASVPASVPKTARRVPQVSIAHDIIAIEHATSLVAAQFHGHACSGSTCARIGGD